MNTWLTNNIVMNIANRCNKEMNFITLCTEYPINLYWAIA